MDAWINSLLNKSVELLFVFRILLSAGLGFVIGFERELYKRPAGLRTHILVCVASCLIMLISMYGFDSGDPGRVAAQVVSGIGFLGAGAILRSDKDIKGITTAATIWMSAAIGLACGNGLYFGAILTTILALIVLTAFRRVESRMVNSSKYISSIYMIVKDKECTMSKLKEKLDKNNLSVNNFDYKNKEDKIEILIDFEKDTELNSIHLFIEEIEKEYNPIELKLSHE